MNKQFKDICFFGIIFLIIDEAIKIFLSSKLVLNQGIVVIKDFFNIVLVHNTGAAFSILSGNRLFLIVIGLIAIIILLFYIKNGGNYTDFDVFTYSLLLGGVLGNLIDRIIYGYVIDYLSFNFGEFYFPIFNFADICIVVGIVLIILKTIKGDLWK